MSTSSGCRRVGKWRKSVNTRAVHAHARVTIRYSQSTMQHRQVGGACDYWPLHQHPTRASRCGRPPGLSCLRRTRMPAGHGTWREAAVRARWFGPLPVLPGRQAGRLTTMVERMTLLDCPATSRSTFQCTTWSVCMPLDRYLGSLFEVHEASNKKPWAGWHGLTVQGATSIR